MTIPAVMPTYARADLAFERGEGCSLFTADGQRFLDFGSGVAVASLGHAHPRLVEALTTQAHALWHCSNLYRIPGQERLAERLTQESFADTVFFCNSGAEAVEAGLKIVRKYHHVNGRPERTRYITFDGSFHGRTMTTIAAGASAMHKEGFTPLLDAFDQVAFGNINEVRSAVSDKTAGIVVEPVQGEGGLRPADPRFLADLRAVCDEFGLLLFFDEVQCGMGRTGTLFAYQQSGVAPDVMALAKGLGGGFPIGACLATEAAAQGMTAGTHGSTFGGNPLAVAVANAVLDEMLAPDFLPRVRQSGERLGAGLKKIVGDHPSVLEAARGVGLMWGVKCMASNAELNAAMTRRGLLTVLAADNVVRFIPPLIAGPAEIDEALGILAEACTELES